MLKTEVLASFYQDSVVLMRVSAQVRGLPGVTEFAMFMGTPLNHAVLEQAGLVTDAGRQAGPNDLIITVDAANDEVAANAIAEAKRELLETRKAKESSSEFRPRSLDSALGALPEANLVALSIPGAYVKAEAIAALKRKLNLFIFSDNVPLEDEIEMKQEALRRGLLCMGPDQGTAYLGGVGLGFANMVRRGRIGCVAASGTGMQTVVARIDNHGEGISNAIGVGGRDLSEAVGGVMTLFALDVLAADPATEVIVLISKPPHPSVLERLGAKLATIAKPVVVCCIGAEPASSGKAVWVATLDQAADAALALLAGRAFKPGRCSDAAALARTLAQAAGEANESAGKNILCLYTGGTLAYETGYLFKRAFGAAHPHQVLDLGDDQYTVGRPHPMIDPTLRNDMIAKSGRDASVGVVVVDLVLGTGAHENPAESLAAAVRAAREAAALEGRTLEFVGYILGTQGDPQGLASQVEQLEAAGVVLFDTNADAARYAAIRVKPELAKQWLEDL